MSSTSSTAHRRDFCRALYLQPSPEKLGRAGGEVYSVKSLRLFSREFKEIREFSVLLISTPNNP